MSYNVPSASAAKTSSMDGPGIDFQSLIDKSRKMGLTPDIRDMIISFEDCKNILKAKEVELDTLQAIVMESDDENISTLREELFIVAKLLYSDVIEDVIKREVNDTEVKMDNHFDINEKSVAADVTSWNIINRISEYRRKRRIYSENLTKIKKRLKENVGL